MKEVKIPGRGIVQFADHYTDEQIDKVLATKYKYERVGNAEKPGLLDAAYTGILQAGAAGVLGLRETGLIDDDRAADWVSGLTKEAVKVPLHPVIKDFMETGESGGDTFRKFIKNPLTISAYLAAQSIAGSAIGLGASLAGTVAGGAAGAVAGPGGAVAGAIAGRVVGAGAGSFAVEYGSNIIDSFVDAGIDVTNPTKLKEAFNNQDLMEKARTRAIQKGVPIAAFDAVSAGIAGQLFKAGTRATQVSKRLETVRKIGSFGAELALQGTLGAAGSVVGDLVAGEPVNYAEALGEFTGEAMLSGPLEVWAALRTGDPKAAREAVDKRLAALRAEYPEINEAAMFGFGKKEPGAPEGEVVKGKTPFDREAMFRHLGISMYEDPSQIGPVAVKEMLQNSLDAIRIAQSSDPNFKGNIDIILDKDNREITLEDNATGMTREQFENAFLTIGGSEKEGTQSAGGFGLAKMGFLFPADTVKVQTVREGKKQVLETTGLDLMNENFEWKSNIPTDEPSGTRITIKLPERGMGRSGKESDVKFPGRWDLDILGKPFLIPNTEVRTYQSPVEYQEAKELAKGRNSDLADFYGARAKLRWEGDYKADPMTTLDFDWGSVDLYETTDADKYTYGKNVTVLNNGVYQFETGLGINPSGAFEKLSKYLMNVRPNVEATNPRYPIAKNRQSFSNRATEELLALNKFLLRLRKAKEMMALGEEYGTNIVEIPEAQPSDDLIDYTQRFVEKQANPKSDVGKALKKDLADKQAAFFSGSNLMLPKRVRVENGRFVDASGNVAFDGSQQTQDVEALDLSKYRSQIPVNPMGVHFTNNTNVDLVKRLGPAGMKFISEMGTIAVELKQAYINLATTDPETASSFGTPDFLNSLITMSFEVSEEKKASGNLGTTTTAPITAYYINVPEIFKRDKKGPRGVAYRFVDTVLHELNHFNQMNHAEGFQYRLENIQTILYDNGVLQDVLSRVQQIILNNQDVINRINEIRNDPSTKNVKTTKGAESRVSGLDGSESGVSGSVGGPEPGPGYSEASVWPVSATARGPVPREPSNWDTYRDQIRNTLEHLLGSRPELTVETIDYLPERRDGRPIGLFTWRPDTVRSIVSFSLALIGQYNVPATVAHEAFHFAQTFLLTPAEVKILKNSERKMLDFLAKYSSEGEKLSAYLKGIPNAESRSREIQAYMVQMYATNPANFEYAANTGIFKKIANFFTRLGNWISGMGFRNADDVMRSFLNGEFASRPISVRRHVESQIAMREQASAVGMTADNFVKWFNGSIITNPDGSPRTMFHGSDANFREFGITADIGYHFTPRAATANFRIAKEQRTSYGNILRTYDTGSLVYPVYLNLKNPLRLSDLGGWQPVQILEALKKAGTITKDEHKRLYRNISDTPPNRNKKVAFKELIDTIRSKGYDGIVYANDIEGVGEDNYIVFGDEPQRIKSIFNQQFNPNDPNMDMSLFQTAWKAVKNSPDLLASANQIGWWQQLLQSPRHLASRIPALQKIFQATQERNKYRMLVMAEAIARDKFGALQEADATQYQNISRVLIAADASGIWPRTGPSGDATLTLPNGMVLNLTPEENRIYRATVDGFRFLVDSWDTAYRERNEDLFVRNGLPVTASLPTLKQWVQIMRQLRTQNPTNARITQALREMVPIVNYLDELNGLRVRPYFPHIRFGTKAITVRDQNGKIIHLETVETNGLLHRNWKTKEREAIQRLQSQYPGLRVGSFEMFADTLRKTLLDNNLLSQLEYITTALASSNPQLYNNARQVIDFAEEEIKKKGFRSHLTRRKGIPGYSFDVKRVIGTYLLGASNMAAQLRYAGAISDAFGQMRQMPDIDSSVVDYADTYIKYTTSPVEEFSRFRQFNFMYFLGGNLSSAVMQLASLPEFLVPLLSQFGAGGALAETLRATKDMARFVSETAKQIRVGNKPPDKTIIINAITAAAVFPNDPQLAQDIVAAFNEGSLKPILTLDQMGLDPNRAADSLSAKSRIGEAISWLPVTFNLAETMARGIAFIAAHRQFRKQGVRQKAASVYAKNANYQALPSQTPANFASFMVDEAFGMYGKVNRARVFRGPGSLILQFASYPAQMIELLSRALFAQGPRGKMAFALAMIALFMFGGWQGWPLAENLKEMTEMAWKGATGVDKDFAQIIREFSNEVTGTKWAGEIVNKGFFRYFGIDIASRTTLGRFAPLDAALNLLSGQDPSETLGVPGSMIWGNISNFKKHLTATGDFFGSVMEVAPLALRNMYQAFKWNTEDVRTPRGELVLKKENLSAGELIAKAFGFNPAEVAQARERRFAMTRAEALVKDKQATYYTKMANSFVRMRNANTEGRADDAEKERKAVRKLLDDVRKYNEKAPLEEKIIIDGDYLKQLIVQLETGRDPKVPRKAVKKVQDIKESFPDAGKGTTRGP